LIEKPRVLLGGRVPVNTGLVALSVKSSDPVYLAN